ncbi:unnamed protein product [Pleuronectes platessa]|uniref:Uncharacterized protein n=1 Tax=Pleuronectes platessa TaxID=8262 RepID=A0A9N7U6S3_PLEPL|nr:unnamed protein product [Pleuronectes platessa]
MEVAVPSLSEFDKLDDLCQSVRLNTEEFQLSSSLSLLADHSGKSEADNRFTVSGADRWMEVMESGAREMTAAITERELQPAAAICQHLILMNHLPDLWRLSFAFQRHWAVNSELLYLLSSFLLPDRAQALGNCPTCPMGRAAPDTEFSLQRQDGCRPSDDPGAPSSACGFIFTSSSCDRLMQSGKTKAQYRFTIMPS